MTIVFRYGVLPEHVNKTPKPVVKVNLMGKENFNVIALIDSGADISVIPKGLAEFRFILL